MPGPTPRTRNKRKRALKAKESLESSRAHHRAARPRSAPGTIPTPAAQHVGPPCNTLDEGGNTRCNRPSTSGYPELNRCSEHHNQYLAQHTKYKEAQAEVARIRGERKIPSERDIAECTSRAEAEEAWKWVSSYAEALSVESAERALHSKRFFLEVDEGHKKRIQVLEKKRANANHLIEKLSERALELLIEEHYEAKASDVPKSQETCNHTHPEIHLPHPQAVLATPSLKIPPTANAAIRVDADVDTPATPLPFYRPGGRIRDPVKVIVQSEHSNDIDSLARAKILLAVVEAKRAQEDLAEKRRLLAQRSQHLAEKRLLLEKMLIWKVYLERATEEVEEDATAKAFVTAKSMASQAIERVGLGRLGVNSSSISMPPYPGLTGILDYTRQTRRALLASVDEAVQIAEDEARIVTKSGMEEFRALSNQYLPGDGGYTLVFKPEAMFNGRRLGTEGVNGQRFPGTCNHAGNTIINGGQRGPSPTRPTQRRAMKVVAIGLGSMTLFRGPILGARALLECIARVTALLSNDTTRKWAAPIFGAITLGATAYLFLDFYLPTWIPRIVGRLAEASILWESDGSEPLVSFVDAHAARVAEETRKVLSDAKGDLRERFRRSMDQILNEVRRAEWEAWEAQQWLGDCSVRRRLTGVGTSLR